MNAKIPRHARITDIALTQTAATVVVVTVDGLVKIVKTMSMNVRTLQSARIMDSAQIIMAAIIVIVPLVGRVTIAKMM